MSELTDSPKQDTRTAKSDDENKTMSSPIETPVRKANSAPSTSSCTALKIAARNDEKRREPAHEEKKSSACEDCDEVKFEAID